MPPREPQPGYAATLMGDDSASIIKPLVTALTLTAGLDMMQTYGMALGLNNPAPLMSGTSLTSPVLKSGMTALTGPTNSILAGPKMFTGFKL